VALSIFIFSIRAKAPELVKYGYPGVFLFTFLSFATVFLPAPGVLIVFAMGALLNPLYVALVAGAGAAMGELTGYLVGFGSQPVVKRVNMYQRMVEWVKKYGTLSVIVLSAIPNPFFDLTGAAAGALRMPVLKFLFSTWIGETIKMLVFAYAGGYMKLLFG
jgi:membrane protein DedA with SNARE-associated domain